MLSLDSPFSRKHDWIQADRVFLPYAIAPGSLASIFGTGLAVSTAQAGLSALPSELAAVSVAIGGMPAPLQNVSPTQINLQVLWNLPTGAADVRVVTNGFVLPLLQVSILPYSPAIFAIQEGSGQAAAINLDGSIAGPAGAIPGVAARPAKPGDYIMIFGTGLGPVAPAIADGRSAIDGFRTTLTVPRVLIGGAPAEVTFSGLAPQLAGVNQVNAIVPPVPGGVLPLQLEIGGLRTPDRVTIAVDGH